MKGKMNAEKRKRQRQQRAINDAVEHDSKQLNHDTGECWVDYHHESGKQTLLGIECEHPLRESKPGQGDYILFILDDKDTRGEAFEIATYIADCLNKRSAMLNGR